MSHDNEHGANESKSVKAVRTPVVRREDAACLVNTTNWQMRRENSHRSDHLMRVDVRWSRVEPRLKHEDRPNDVIPTALMLNIVLPHARYRSFDEVPFSPKSRRIDQRFSPIAKRAA